MDVDVERRPVDDVGQVDLDLCHEVRPARRTSAGLARRAEERLAEERREDVREAAEVGHRGKAAAAHARVPEAVVELPPLGVGQHLVRLGHRPEARTRMRVVAHVGMELAREPPERALDLGVARVPRDPEQLVVVLLRRRHQ